MVLFRSINIKRFEWVFKHIADYTIIVHVIMHMLFEARLWYNECITTGASYVGSSAVIMVGNKNFHIRINYRPITVCIVIMILNSANIYRFYFTLFIICAPFFSHTCFL